MPREVPLNELDETLDELTYPVGREEIHTELSDVVLQYADGSEPLPEVLDRTGSDSYGSRDELASELFGVLPVQAVGEPGQSEGEG